MSGFKYSLLAGVALLVQSLFADIEQYFQYSVGPSASNYGNTGILELPNSRFMEEGALRFNFSNSFPFEFTSLTASPFSWLEATYRYAEIKNLKYGPSTYSGNQSLKDKGFDLKIGLINERDYIPSVSLGFRDLAGTGLFASEYLVSSKQIGNLDFTLGIGWGRLGVGGGIKNPFEYFDESFKTRDGYGGGQGGEFTYESWFSGKASLISGIEYDLKKYGLRLKLEYDTSKPELFNKDARVSSRVNFGFNYAFSNSLNFAASYERGNELRFAFTLKGVFNQDTIPKPKPKNVVRLNKEQLDLSEKDRNIFYRSLNRSLRDEQIFIQAANYDSNEVSVAIASSRFYTLTRSAGRTVRIVSALTKKEIEKINIHSMNGDLEVATISVNRKEFDMADIAKSSPSELLLKSSITSSSSEPIYEDSEYMPKVNFPEFRWNVSPSIKHQIGGPEGFYLGQLLLKTDTSIKFSRNLSLYSSFGINIYDTFDNLSNPSQSTIPHVRSDIQDYLEEGKNNIQRMQLEYFSSPFDDIFLRADLGILEEMFAGYGGEVLYRPFEKRFSLGFSLHRVFQRDYDQRFNLRDYETTTGHLGIYRDLPGQVNAQILIGKYLAGDKGVTIDLSRRFETGFTLGIFATKTNLSSEEFGEGSFDKGFYFSIPVKLFYSDYRSGNISFGLHPLTKDGGALLNQHNPLFSLLGDSNQNSIERDWKNIID